MIVDVSDARFDRVAERRRAVALARHYRDCEGLSIRQIADRLGRSPATITAYLYDPTGEKAKAVKARYVGVCRGCGANTQPRNGNGLASSALFPTPGIPQRSAHELLKSRILFHPPTAALWRQRRAAEFRVRRASATPRAGGCRSAAAGCAERTSWRSPPVTATR
jgi:hypothetical protein